jgi:hypothetical protein
MTTSGTITFSRNRDQLIASALRKINAFESGETPDSDSVSDASDALNAMVKHWQASGIHIWRTTEAILFPQFSQVRYARGIDRSRDRKLCRDRADLGGGARGASTVVLDSVTGVATTYNIGVQLDDGTIQWTTVNGAPVRFDRDADGGADRLGGARQPGSGLSNQSGPPAKNSGRAALQLRQRDRRSPVEMDRIEYQEMPNKTSTGAVNSFSTTAAAAPTQRAISICGRRPRPLTKPSR